MKHTPLEEAHQSKKRPQDTAIGRAMFKAISKSMMNEAKIKMDGRRNDNIKPNTKAAPVLLVVGIASAVEVVDFYARKK